MPTRDEILARTEQIYNDATAAGFRVSSGAAWTVTGIPAYGGSNTQLVALNAAASAQLAAWNAELAPLWAALGVSTAARAAITPMQNPWGSAGKPLPPNTTINYGNLFQLHQQALAAEDWNTADQLAVQINAITAAGPVVGGFVPVIGVDPRGDAVTPGAGVVYKPDGSVVNVLGVPAPSSATPPGTYGPVTGGLDSSTHQGIDESGQGGPGIGGAIRPSPTGVQAGAPGTIAVTPNKLASSVFGVTAPGGGNAGPGAATIDAGAAPKAKTAATEGGTPMVAWWPLIIAGAALVGIFIILKNK